ncbi:MAG: reverse transcriptase family protein [Candidatus Ozemobacteraceae bacterium]
MSLWETLKKWIFPDPVRDVSRLESEDVDTLQETIDISGKPFKEHHQRRAIRDRRLLPKKKSLLHFGKRKPVMTSEEADRLFASSLRNRGRAIRDLLPDEDQLKRFNLPVWKSEEEIAEALGITRNELRFYSIHRAKERFCNYITFTIPKRSGGLRRIMAPKKRLKVLQRRLLPLLVEHLPVGEHAHGFCTGKSIRTGAEPHVGKKVVVHLDLKDFFPTLHFGRVRGFLIAMGYGYQVATVLAMLMTEAERQPVETDEGIFFVPVTYRYCVQGAPTSPGLSNAIFLKVDRRLAGLARRLGVAYTRYADDLTFSGDDPGVVQPLLKVAERILTAEGFAINPAKTRVMRSGGRQTVTGVVVNRDLGLSRRERRKLRAMAHQLSGKQESANLPDSENDRAERLARLRGKIAYLAMLNSGQADRIRQRL